MALFKAQSNAAVATAMICAGAVSAQFIAGKATRDALFLANLDVTALPAMVVATAVFSIFLVAVSSRLLRRVSPDTFVPLAFVTSAVLLLAAWLATPIWPIGAAQAVYLQISGLGPTLGSGFWLIATEQFDPHAARQHFGRIAGVATLAGLAGALIAERVAALFGVETMLPVLAVMNLVCAWQIRRLVRASGPRTATPSLADSIGKRATLAGMEEATDLAAESPQTGLHALADTPYLRNLAALVLLGTIGATLADYVFKVQAVETFGRGDILLRFFAIYYAATSVLAFAVQTTVGAVALEKLGLAVTTSTPNLALFVGGLGAITVIPGLAGVLLARGAESVFRGSLFRTGYEIFYTPVPPAEKRAAKSIIDVGFDRLGDAIGAGLIRLLLLLSPMVHVTAILGAAVASSALALLVARRLNRGYIDTLERSLLNRAVELDLSNVEDITTRTAVMRTLSLTGTGFTPSSQAPATVATMPVIDPEIQQILALRSRNPDRVLRVLRDHENLPAALVPHVITLLAWDAVAEHAVRALRRVAEDRVGELTDALLDPNQSFAVRRRLARVFSICVSQRAVDALLLALDDTRFEVRFQCGRSLSAIVDKNRLIRIGRERVFEVVRREVTVSRPVWQSHRLLDAIADDKGSFVDEFIKGRAGQSLAHVFVLLSLVLPSAPLQIAYRGLHTDDPGLRGTALEYLEGVLPADIRAPLWPFLGTQTQVGAGTRAREEILADLLRSNESIVMNLEELRRRDRSGA